MRVVVTTKDNTATVPNAAYLQVCTEGTLRIWRTSSMVPTVFAKSRWTRFEVVQERET
jgi:hypothetical protein